MTDNNDRNGIDITFNCSYHSHKEPLQSSKQSSSSSNYNQHRSNAEHNSYLVENWNIETLIDFLKEQNLKLDDDDLGILRKQKVNGQAFLELTKEELLAPLYNFPGEPAIKLAKEIKTLKEKLKRVFSSYNSLKEVLAKYGISSDGTETIPLFLPETHEVQDSNKHFEHCIKNILFRMKNYRSLVLDSLESMHNEYVSTILHTALYIAGDIVSKEFSMRPEYKIIGNESCERVNYAIKEAENLICIIEDKRKQKRADDDFDYLYGIVTSARDWHFLLYSPGGVEDFGHYCRLLDYLENIGTISVGEFELDPLADFYHPALIPPLSTLAERVDIRKKFIISMESVVMGGVSLFTLEKNKCSSLQNLIQKNYSSDNLSILIEITWEREEMKTWRDDLLVKFLYHSNLAPAKYRSGALYDAFSRTNILGLEHILALARTFY
ncbi:hypothetical protein GLOIN_2v1587390 [Rhizophagus clarus]|uniref:SAM domain-containing protein n=1 Tax=Rhizophagus clarus TaxID=94130 RepID=A0A8H3L7E9_9GLOM|nr:hypothetical protein GLOIN_2v1587390 [Rhizophagus clarus]